MKNNIDGRTKLTCIIGNPVGHSKSPYMHNLAFNSLGLNFAYTAFHIEEGELGQAMKAIKTLGIKGCNVTMPYKEEVIKHIDRVDEGARLIGAVNTVENDNGSLIGYNTDGKGFLKSLKVNGVEYKGKKVVILGGGGTAKALSIEFALDGVGELVIVNRSLARAEEIKATIDGNIGEVHVKALELDRNVLEEEFKGGHIVINTTSLGMGDQEGQSVVEDHRIFHKDLFVADVIYQPETTRFLELAKEAGCKTMNGIGMLIYQGDIAFKIWTGKNMPEKIINKLRGDLLGKEG